MPIHFKQAEKLLVFQINAPSSVGLKGKDRVTGARLTKYMYVCNLLVHEHDTYVQHFGEQFEHVHAERGIHTMLR